MAKKKAPTKKKAAVAKADGDSVRNGKPKTKAAKVREYKAAHPDASYQDISQATGESYNTVYQTLKAKLGGKKKKKPGRKPGKVSAKHTSNGHASVISTAAAFVASCGGLKSAQQVLEQLSIIGSH